MTAYDRAAVRSGLGDTRPPAQRLASPDNEIEELANRGEQQQWTAQLRATLDAAPQQNRTGLPDSVKSGIENLSGRSLDGVRVHYNSAAPAQLNALAYTQGTDIHVAPGEQKHVPHEAWHVVQQMQGRVAPTRQLRGVDLNDDDSLEREADVMGARAVQRAASNDLELDDQPVQRREGVVQRAMGMEIEMRRRVSTDQGADVVKGDTTLVSHEYFELVTDWFDDYSNLELVMKKFDQLDGTEQEAIDGLNARIDAMKAFAEKLYANEGKLSDLVPELDPAEDADLRSHDVAYKDDDDDDVAFQSGDAQISAPVKVANEDNLLYVHYTVGFAPEQWLDMLTAVGKIQRDDTANTRPKSNLTEGLAAANAAYGVFNTVGFTADEQAALKGHLALMYMQMEVFVDQTLDSAEEATQNEIDEIDREIDGIDNMNIPKRRKKSMAAMRQRKVAKKAELQTKLATIQGEIDFAEGMPKNDIAALPRASLRQMLGALPQKVQNALMAKGAAEKVLRSFSTSLETDRGLDLPEKFEIDNEIGEVANLRDFLRGGMAPRGKEISQETLFGGMTEVPIETEHGKKLLPLEFRNVYKRRVTWDELRADALKLLKWSRDPKNTSPE